MRPQPDDYPDHIERALEALTSDGLDAGAAALEPIAYPPRDLAGKRRVGREVMAQILRRDHFLCRYCGGKTIVTPVMELLGALYPEAFPFQSSGWKAGVTHPAIISRSPAIDHVLPVAYGGGNDPDNLVTACNACNTIKSDFTLEDAGVDATSDRGIDLGRIDSLLRAAVGARAKTETGLPPQLDAGPRS